MTKSELRTGMVVTYRDGRKAMVYTDCHYSYLPNDLKSMAGALITEEGTWSDLRCYNENLTSTSHPDLDIMEVEIVEHPRFLWASYNSNHYRTIWERNPPKKMTVAEIESILGYRVEIISEQ